jgi:RNA polymerase sigma-70 factor (ECF subfamily)
MQDSDGAMIAQALEGDRDAFRVLVERHSRAVFRLAFRITGNESDAEDVVQESFLRAWRQLHRYEARAGFGTWMYRIASNYALDLVRARRRRSSEELVEGTLAFASDGPLPDRLAFSAEVRRRLETVMATLTPQERLAFTLRHMEGQSIEEIGAVLGTAANATKNSIFRAVQKLRKGLGPAVGATQ